MNAISKNIPTQPTKKPLRPPCTLQLGYGRPIHPAHPIVGPSTLHTTIVDLSHSNNKNMQLSLHI